MAVRECALEQARQRPLQRSGAQVIEPDLGHWTRYSTALVMALHELIEEADSEGRGTLGHQWRVLLRPRHPRDVEVRQRNAVDEALENLRRRAAAGSARVADVLHVGGVAVDLAVVGLAQRHAPERLLRDLAGGGQSAGELIVVAEHAGIFVAER